MADLYRRNTRVIIRVTVVLLARLHDLPLIGTHVGAGTHVNMPLTFTLQQLNPGWTTLPYRLSRRLHPTNDDWGCMIRQETQDLFANPAIRDARLSPAQQTAFSNALAAAIPIDAVWNSAADNDDDPTQSNGS